MPISSADSTMPSACAVDAPLGGDARRREADRQHVEAVERVQHHADEHGDPLCPGHRFARDDRARILHHHAPSLPGVCPGVNGLTALVSAFAEEGESGKRHRCSGSPHAKARIAHRTFATYPRGQAGAGQTGAAGYRGGGRMAATDPRQIINDSGGVRATVDRRGADGAAQRSGRVRRASSAFASAGISKKGISSAGRCGVVLSAELVGMGFGSVLWRHG